MSGRLVPTRRLGIDDVRPRVAGGEIPTKAAVGEVVPISAYIWREGHDAVSATVTIRGPETSPTMSSTTRIHMERSVLDPDVMNAIFVPDVPGLWTFRIDAWSDPYATWLNAVTKKLAAGQTADELANDLAIGAQIFDKAAKGAALQHRPHLTAVAAQLRSDAPLRERIAPATSPVTQAILAESPVRDLLTRGRTYKVNVSRSRALVGAWYEFFPRSTGGVDASGTPIHGTFRTAAAALDRIAAMNFDVVYMPPIHPIGTINRKGRNNTLTPEPGDVGSPWAIGSADGGHDAIHPQLGTMDDFDAFVARARELDLEIALDLALQCAPDHPWAAAHPEWFTVLPDGTIAYAENPPKKYQDIYPLNFDNDPEGIFAEILRVVKLWISHGVKIFRVDNPHTKPANFWAHLIAEVHEKNPEVVFLAEAFTRRPRLYGLAKAGFDQSYTYFTWQTSKYELERFAEEIRDAADVSRPNLFVNTPDILHASLQYGGKPMFAIRAALAATMSPTWGVYSGFELYEHEAVAPGSEEYNNSEKYELRPRDFDAALAAGESLQPFITLLNDIRRQTPALHQLRTLRVIPSDSDKVIAYSKTEPTTGNAVVIVVALDPSMVCETTIHLDLGALGLDAGTFPVRDLITGQQWTWGADNYIRLDPDFTVCHIVELPTIPPERRAGCAHALTHSYDYTC